MPSLQLHHSQTITHGTTLTMHMEPLHNIPTLYCCMACGCGVSPMSVVALSGLQDMSHTYKSHLNTRKSACGELHSRQPVNAGIILFWFSSNTNNLLCLTLLQGKHWQCILWEGTADFDLLFCSLCHWTSTHSLHKLPNQRSLWKNKSKSGPPKKI